jgi:DNA-directed RNA polymerase II subunit RPB2
MNLETETWDVINSYFRDTPNNLVKHHIDSYNDFIKNKIPLIFKNFNHQKVFRFDKENQNFRYIINIYYGGKNADRYKITKPTIIDHSTGEKKQMYPNEARLKNLTYGFDFFYDIDVEFTIEKGDKKIIEDQPIYDNSFLKDIYLGRIPIMLHSDMCVLSGMEDEILNQMGECRYDPGGYFIIDGREKNIISQERKAENMIFLQKITNLNDKYSHIAEIKSISTEAFTYSRTVKLQTERKGPITVRLGQSNPFLQPVMGRDVPLFIMFRVLGVETDKEILQYILGDLDTPLSKKLIELLHPSVIDPYIVDNKIYDKASADMYLEKLPSRAIAEGKDKISEIHNNRKHRLALLYQALYENFLPHCGRDFKSKAFFLGYMTRKLLLRMLDLEPDTDKDNFVNKRIDISGFMLSTLFRDAFEQMKRAAKIEIGRIYEFNHKEYSEERFPFIINVNNYFKIFDFNKFKEHFIDSIKKGTLGTKQGVVQSMERVNYYATLSHLRRIADPVNGVVSLSRRRLHTTQYGGICPFETPEGQNVGLRKALAMTSLITFGIGTSKLVQLLSDNGLVNLNDIHLSDFWRLTRIIINGNIIGCHNNPIYLIKLLKLYRRNGLINIYVGILYDYLNNEICINTDNGRIVRPLYIIENNNFLIQPKHIENLKKGKIKYMDLVSGFADRKTKLNVFLDEVNELSSIGIDKDKDNFISILKENQGVIEYIDTAELSRTLLTRGYIIPENTIEKFTHCELHTSMAFGLCANLVPYLQNAAAARGIFASKQIKQGANIYATNFKNRLDTSVHLLHYPNKPLSVGRMYKILNNDKMGTGQNVCVAICHYNGCNADDGIIGNKSSVEMGLLNTSYFKMYEEVEKVDKKKNISEKFYNPNIEEEKIRHQKMVEEGVTGGLNAELAEEAERYRKLLNKDMNYDHLDKYGFIKEGTYLEGGEVLIGKYLKMNDEAGREIMSDMSKKVKKDNVNSVVDKVYTAQINANGDRLVKIRTVQYRYPVIGDKLASRCAQKGTFGILLDREDMPYGNDGLVPDLLLTPYGYPTRMTVNQLLEILVGNLTTELGFFNLASPLEPINPEQVNDLLCDKLGLTNYGDRTLYNGITGEQMDVKIYSGVIYYQRLKYMVNDKINTRSSGHRENGIPMPGGAYTIKERQVVPGRALGGGLRIGEMERDALLSHGVLGFLKESVMERSDKFYIYLSAKTGELSIVNPEEEIYIDPSVDGPINYQIKDHSNIADGNLGVYIDTQNQMDFHRVEVPYSFKLLLQEMQGLGINLRIKADSINLALSRGVIDEEIIDDMVEELDDEIMEDMEDFGYNDLNGDELYEVMIDSQFDENINSGIIEDNVSKKAQDGAGTSTIIDKKDETTGDPIVLEQDGGEVPEPIVEMPKLEFKEGAIDNELNTSVQYGGMHNISINPDIGDKNDININIQKGGDIPAEFQTSGLMQPMKGGPPNLNPDLKPTGNNSGLNININTQTGGNTQTSGYKEQPKNDNIKTITIEGGALNEFGGFIDINKNKNKRSKFTNISDGTKNIEFGGGGNANKDVSFVTKQDAIYSIDPMLNIDNENL